MHHRSTFAHVLLFLVVAVLCLPQLSCKANADDDFFQKNTLPWVQAVNTGRLGALYEEDAVLLLPDNAIIRTRDRIVAHYKTTLKSRITLVSQAALIRKQSAAFQLGTCTLASGEVRTYAAVYRLISGKWLRTIEMWDVQQPGARLDTAGIMKDFKQYTDAARRGDLEGYMRMYTEDSINVQPHAIIPQKFEVKMMMSQFILNNAYELSATPRKLLPVRSDLAYEIGELAWKPKNSAPADYVYIYAWKLTGSGKWNKYKVIMQFY